MTILDCRFYASDSLIWDVSLEYIAKLVVAWLYTEYAVFFKTSYMQKAKDRDFIIGMTSLLNSSLTVLSLKNIEKLTVFILSYTEVTQAIN